MKFQDIIAATEAESAARRSKESLKSLKWKIRDLPPTLGFARALSARPFGIIAEIKTKSPSMGRMTLLAEKAAAIAHRIYDRHPLVSAISVLTQNQYFGGSEKLLRVVRRESRKPILRKDFIFSEYEIYFSRYIGADAILLMANVVTDAKKFADYHALANELGMDVLCEVHTEAELAILPPSTRVCGINSRKFTSDGRFLLSKLTRKIGKDASVDMGAFDLYDRLPPEALKIAESGVGSDNIRRILEKYDFNAALIGTSLLTNGAEGIRPELDRLQAEVAQVHRAMPAISRRPSESESIDKLPHAITT